MYSNLTHIPIPSSRFRLSYSIGDSYKSFFNLTRASSNYDRDDVG